MVQVIEWLLEKDGEGYVLKSNVKNPFPTGYKPEIDVMEEFGPKLALHFMQLIGIVFYIGPSSLDTLISTLKSLFFLNIKLILTLAILRQLIISLVTLRSISTWAILPLT